MNERIRRVFRALGLTRTNLRRGREWARAAFTRVSPPKPETWAFLDPAADRYSSIVLRPSPEAPIDHPSWPSPALRRRSDVICLSIIDWEFRFQRPQQMMAQFAAHGHRVFYVSVSRFLHNAHRPRVTLHPLAPNVFEVRLAVTAPPPQLYSEVITGKAQDALLESLDELRRIADIADADVYVMVSAWTPLALKTRTRWGWRVVYDCMDEWENFPGIHPALPEAERTLVHHADVLVVSAERLLQKWQQHGRTGVLARNAADYSFYAERCVPNDLLAGVKHPIIGYYGAIADWFDVKLVERVARERPHATFVLVGGVFDVDVSSLEALPNVKLLGQQPYERMPQYLYHFDVATIPFKVNPITEATDPVKLYEYLAGGKPVVTTALPEVASRPAPIHVAKDADDFIRQLDLALGERDQAAADARRLFASRETWAARYEQVHDAVAATVPKVSIVIVTYNNLALTRLCLDSVLRNTDYPRYEVVIVDNASTDGTPEYLRALAAAVPHVSVVLNAENGGFSRANNQGLRQSTGGMLVLLNNDTVVPPGWLTRLLRPLRDPAIGLTGPMSNFVGNEAFVAVDYSDWAGMEAFARRRAAAFDGRLADIHVLAMYCLAMRRETYERLGPLDEGFGAGMFEDDDYAYRARAAGLRVVCVGDAFVHHVGQASFKGLIADKTYNPLFERNRKRFEEKWQVQWTPHVQKDIWGQVSHSNRVRSHNPTFPEDPGGNV